MNRRKGFTIIEVVLVLAVAGLIFLMVFVAVPAMQRAQKNMTRKQDLNRFLSAFETYRGHNPSYPFVENPDPLHLGNTGYSLKEGFVHQYIDEGIDYDNASCKTGNCQYFRDPNGSLYHFSQPQEPGVDALDAVEMDNTVWIFVKSACGSNENELTVRTGLGQYALVYRGEGGTILCVNNN